jgi:hypothetical protein
LSLLFIIRVFVVVLFLVSPSTSPAIGIHRQGRVLKLIVDQNGRIELPAPHRFIRIVQNVAS